MTTRCVRCQPGLESGPVDSMKSDSDREVTIFTEAIKVSVEDRAAFLANACGGDENLRRKVEALLEAHDRLGNFLEEPGMGDPPNEAD